VIGADFEGDGALLLFEIRCRIVEQIVGDDVHREGGGFLGDVEQLGDDGGLIAVDEVQE